MAAPATTGVAIDVPCIVRSGHLKLLLLEEEEDDAARPKRPSPSPLPPSPTVDAAAADWSTPGATRSGLILPSGVGRFDEKPASESQGSPAEGGGPQETVIRVGEGEEEDEEEDDLPLPPLLPSPLLAAAAEARSCPTRRGSAAAGIVRSLPAASLPPLLAAGMKKSEIRSSYTSSATAPAPCAAAALSANVQPPRATIKTLPATSAALSRLPQASGGEAAASARRLP